MDGRWSETRSSHGLQRTLMTQKPKPPRPPKPPAPPPPEPLPPGLRGLGPMAVTRTHFAFRIDMWTPNGESIVELIAGVEDIRQSGAASPALPEMVGREAIVTKRPTNASQSESLGTKWPLMLKKK